MDEIQNENQPLNLPVVALRDIVIYPRMSVNLDIGRKESVEAVRFAGKGERYLVMAMQKDSRVEVPQEDDLYDVCTVVKVTQMLQMPGGLIRVLVEGVSRVKLLKVTRGDRFLSADVDDIEEIKPEDELRAEAFRRTLLKSFFEWLHNTKQGLPEDQMEQLKSITDPGETADFIASQLLLKPQQRQRVLEEADVASRLKLVQGYLDMEIEIVHLESEISSDVRQKMDKEQKDYYLRQKIKSIHDRLGDTVSQDQEAEDYRKKLADSAIPEEYKKKLEKEINHLESMPPMMAETAVARNYLDWVFSLPWDKETKDSLELKKAQEVLDHDHYGLEKIKERILEYLAVRILAPEAKAPIICFVGPPGVGKTSLAQSIARAMNRKYCRISLGGIHDEAEIRGHRRTYIGAMPGRFIEAISEVGVNNPLMLLDEIDKVGSDFRGDPASALLEALDPEQNKAFHDNYIDIPFDFSKVFFLATANSVSTIPAALLDRMELIELTGYTEEEKLEIAKKYLVPRQKERNGLKDGDIRFTPALLKKVITGYTREAGVRNLERTIGALCRKVGKKIVLQDDKLPPLSVKTLDKYLGPVKFLPLAEEHPDAVGRVNGLAWTIAGGEVLDTEAVTIKGKGHLILTGQMGDVMKESAETAYTYIRSKAKDLGLKDDFYETLDTHIHLPEGAVPKDGPSAGITMATAMASAYTGRRVRGDTAMTGEITLTGEVLPIGGVKEKVLAANEFGIKQILLPEKNKRDLEELPKSVQDKLQFVYVKNVQEVLEHALVK
ncbi:MULTISPECIES: endopeptidase La [Dialister]|jgi:ATP-dependent Lon protease|uniref:Lon protease n=2 Tax=Dialister hominis TaxID=2582419 RepID=A0A8D5A564_9FIRM|nr:MULTISPECIES: endopeptidase La [Dialister]UYJ17046.1 MAG: endopeptidase La [Veillonellaceae bacterium]MBS6413030.1 endopeptidase La [Dialister sp.]MCH3912997.1 endopeptidase La [Dialister sp.]MCH3929240.1 endopeptidase La [Dialister sp.]CDD81416.1 lon protease [Dialister sp. CAG:357]